MSKLSPETQELLSYILRGVRKGFTVDILEYFDDCSYTNEQKIKVLSDLHNLSDQREKLEVLLRACL